MFSKNQNKKFILFALPILIIGIYGIIAQSQKIWPFSNAKIVDPNSIQQKTDNPSPKNNNPISKDDTKSSSENRTTDQIPVDQSLKATIDQLTQNDSSVLFGATVTNAKEVGSCVVTFSTTNDRPVVKEFEAKNKDGVSICGPLQISSFEFSYLGEWSVTLRYYENGSQVVAQSKIDIK